MTLEEISRTAIKMETFVWRWNPSHCKHVYDEGANVVDSYNPSAISSLCSLSYFWPFPSFSCCGSRPTLLDTEGHGTYPAENAITTFTNKLAGSSPSLIDQSLIFNVRLITPEQCKIHYTPARCVLLSKLLLHMQGPRSLHRCFCSPHPFFSYKRGQYPIIISYVIITMSSKYL